MLTSAYLAYGLAAWLALLTLQAVIAAGVKNSQPGALPGKINPDLGHASFVFRAHRTWMNSLENAPLLLGGLLLAWMVGANPHWSAALLWLCVLGRTGHMLLYYLHSTEKNPSPRSLFFMISWLAQVGLLLLGLLTLLNTHTEYL